MRRALDVAGVMVVAAGLALPDGALGQTSSTQDGERLASLEMAWPVVTTGSVSARVRAAAEAMTGQPLRRPPVVVPITPTAIGSRRMRVTVPDAPALEIDYLADYDEMRIVDAELAASLAPEGEMSQDEAVRMAKRVFDELANRKVVDPRHFDWQRADVAATWAGSGSMDGKTSDRKRVEYRVTVRRSINGIELANAGLRIAVHATGRVSGLRLGGVSVRSKPGGNLEEPTGLGRWRSRQVSDSDAKARFERETAAQKGRVKVAWARVMYVMPENKRSAVVEPLYVVSYSLEVPTDEGETVVSRRRTLGFSLTDPNAPPVDLTPPTRAPVIERTRKPEVDQAR